MIIAPSICVLITCFTLLNLSTSPVQGKIKRLPFDSSSDSRDSDSEESETRNYTTVEITTQQLRGVPDDVREFWGDQYIYITIATVLEGKLCEIFNITMDKVQYWINRTNEAIEKQLTIITNYEWKERNERLPPYQKSEAEKLAKYWKEIENHFKTYLDTVYDAREEVDEMRKALRESQNSIARRCAEIDKQMKMTDGKTR